MKTKIFINHEKSYKERGKNKRRQKMTKGEKK